MGDVVQLRPDQDERLASAWAAMSRAYQVALAQPSLRNMAVAVRAYDAFAALAGSPRLLDDEARA